MAIEITKRPYQRCFSGNPVHYELYSELAVNNPTNVFEVRVMFRHADAADFTSITTNPIPFNPVAGYATVDIQDILDSVLEHEIPPISDVIAFTAAPKQSGYFYVQFREVTEANPAPSWDETEAEYERFVLKGGIEYFHYQGNNYWINYFEINKPFLTWQKSGRLAAAGERMFLGWLNYTDVTPGFLKVVVKSYKLDGTLNETKEEDFDAEKDIVYYIPAGADQWGINTNPAVQLLYWTVQVWSYFNPLLPASVSELFSYYLDNKQDYNNITLNYRNSLGCLDSARVLGLVERKARYQNSLQQKTIRPDYFDGRYFNPQLVVSGNKEQVVFSGNLGQMKKEEQDRLRDLQVIREVWWGLRSKWWPVNVLTQEFTLTRSEDNRWHMPIEFTLAHEGSTHYTPLSVDLGEGVFNSNVCKAKLIDITVEVNLSAVDAEVFIDAVENDPQDASTQFRYRIPDLIGFIEWQNASYDDLPLSLSIELERVVTIELQALCDNNVAGKIASARIDTRADAPVGGGRGGGVIGGNSAIYNHTANGTEFTLDLDGPVAIGYLGASATFDLMAADAVGITIVLTLTDLSPSSVTLTPAGGLPIAGMISGNTVTWNLVSFTGGFSIDIY